MTELPKLKCECCGAEAVGVCSTIIPYSAAFCRTCLEKRAQPRWIMDFIIEEHLDGDISNAADWVHEVTIFDGAEYISFKDYFKRKQ